MRVLYQKQSIGVNTPVSHIFQVSYILLSSFYKIDDEKMTFAITVDELELSGEIPLSSAMNTELASWLAQVYIISFFSGYGKATCHIPRACTSSAFVFLGPLATRIKIVMLGVTLSLTAVTPSARFVFRDIIPSGSGNIASNASGSRG
jgi:hypothetical protein